MTDTISAFPVYAVDDQPQILDLIGIICQDHGIECRPFSDGARFVAELDQLEPGCVLLDMHMPGLTGLQVQEAIADRASSFAVIAITGYGDVDIAVQSMRLGAMEFLEKPFLPEVLIAALEEGFRVLHERLHTDEATSFRRQATAQ